MLLDEIFKPFNLFSGFVAFSGFFSEFLNLDLIRMSVEIFFLDFFVPESNKKLLQFVLIKTVDKSLNLSGLEEAYQFDVITHEVFGFTRKTGNHGSEINKENTCECHMDLRARCCSKGRSCGGLSKLVNWC